MCIRDSDGAVQRESAVQRVTKIGILERGRSLGLVGLLGTIYYYIFRSVHDALVPMVLVLVSLFLRCVAVVI